MQETVDIAIELLAICKLMLSSNNRGEVKLDVSMLIRLFFLKLSLALDPDVRVVAEQCFVDLFCPCLVQLSLARSFQR